MQRAKYFCSGNADIAKYQHYALNEPVYTHFTSPIRRYADVMVHRLLESALEGKSKYFLFHFKKERASNLFFFYMYRTLWISSKIRSKNNVYM